MKALIAAVSGVSGFLGVFSAIDTLVSGVWLAVLGRWGAIGWGIVGIFFSVVVLSFALAPGLALRRGIIAAAEHGSRTATLALITLSCLYAAAVMTAWALAVYAFFMSGSDARSRVPLLLWSFGLATGPWVYMASQEATPGGRVSSVIATFFAELGYVLIILVALFSPAVALPVLAFVFGTVMLVAVALQVPAAIALSHAPSPSLESLGA